MVRHIRLTEPYTLLSPDVRELMLAAINGASSAPWRCLATDWFTPPWKARCLACLGSTRLSITRIVNNSCARYMIRTRNTPPLRVTTMRFGIALLLLANAHAAIAADHPISFVCCAYSPATLTIAPRPAAIMIFIASRVPTNTASALTAKSLRQCSVESRVSGA